MFIIKLITFVFTLLISFSGFAHGEKKHHDMTPPDSLAVSLAIDTQGNLWRVGASEGFVEVSKSADLGKTFSKPVKVNAEQQKITAHGEVRPKIKLGKNGEIYVVWMQNLKAQFSGYVWFARSVNGGKSFEAPIVVHQDRQEIGHAFEEISVSPNGDITILWLDSRDLVADKIAGKKRSGSSIYYAVSRDAGKTFEPEKKLADNTCECCRIVTTNKPDGTVVAMWRHVFEGSERDHMIAEIPSKKPALQANNHALPRRATFGHWVIDGCPHHGAALASGGEGKDWWGYHMAYFDGNDKKPGLYYSRMDGVAWASSPPQKFGDNAKQAGHPSLLSMGNRVWLVWREINQDKYSIKGLVSEDGGKNWSEEKVIDTVDGKSDYPSLVVHNNVVYMAWNTRQKGLRVIALM